MSAEIHGVQVLKSVPVVTCPSCKVEMAVKHLEPAADEGKYTAKLRCPKCGTETMREFTASPSLASG